jgi:hypothetical protein
VNIYLHVTLNEYLFGKFKPSILIIYEPHTLTYNGVIADIVGIVKY